MNEIQKIESQIDQSVNLIYPALNIGQYEARYVRREDEYFIIYVSSQSGCDQACRMCHLTATGQNKLENATLDDFFKQANLVYSHYDKQPNKAKLVHYNFMARGEALNNPVVLNQNDELLGGFERMAHSRGLEAKHLISTIMPESMGNRTLVNIFPRTNPEIYYSLYSTNDKFRKKWLARALPYERSLEMLKQWQEYSGKTPKIHFAFIKGENDSEEDMYNMAEAIKKHDLKVNLNIVRYNPYSDKYGTESDECVIHRNTEILVELLKPEQYRIVPKVGFDVKASCGMFVGKTKM
jgi:adenine C2-methylase RlmN of 23S rRNA A2503 and tRNA A37